MTNVFPPYALPHLILAIAAATFGVPTASGTDYDEWIRFYAGKPPSGWFPGREGTPRDVPVPLKLIVTAIEGDEPRDDPRMLEISGPSAYGCQVAVDGRVHHFFRSPRGVKGAGYPALSEEDRKRLDQLLLKLPDDGARLPPPNRRVVLQVPDGDHCRARVYDRADAPDEVCEILRLSLSGIRSWMPTCKSQSDLTVGRHATDGLLALFPDGQLVIGSGHGPLRLWDPKTRQEPKELPDAKMTSHGIKFSPDGTLAVLTGSGAIYDCAVLETKTWKVVQSFREPMVGRYQGGLRFPQFTADGRFLLFLCRQPDADGHGIDLLRAYDTETWEKLDRLPGLPDEALTCIESPTGKRALVLLKGDILALWDPERRRRGAQLDAEIRIHEVAFSPDETLVALATLHRRDGKYWTIYRIRVWKADTGELVHELRPFEQATCENVVGLQWTADGRYILAATQAHGFFTNCDINVWDAISGRHRGNLGEGPSHPTGVVVLPDGRQIAAGGVSADGSVVRLWDLADALRQIRAFEDSLGR